MKKSDFLNLNELEKIDFINTKLTDQKLSKIAEEMGISQSWLSKHLIELGYRYKQGQYIKTIQEVEKIPKANNVSIMTLLDGVEVSKTELKEAILWAVKQSNKDTIPIEINTEYINHDEKPKGRTFLVPEEVLKMWDEFCKRHIIYQNQHLLMMALLEYINNHK